MPLRDFECACGAKAERYYLVRGGEIQPVACNDCGESMSMLPLSAGTVRGKTDIFPYTTTHLSGDGKPVTVESLGHLRRLEKRYGACVTGFSMDSSDSPRDLPVARPGGRDYEGPRAPWMGG